jgi:hypothetical protein
MYAWITNVPSPLILESLNYKEKRARKNCFKGCQKKKVESEIDLSKTSKTRSINYEERNSKMLKMRRISIQRLANLILHRKWDDLQRLISETLGMEEIMSYSTISIKSKSKSKTIVKEDAEKKKIVHENSSIFLIHKTKPTKSLKGRRLKSLKRSSIFSIQTAMNL